MKYKYWGKQKTMKNLKEEAEEGWGGRENKNAKKYWREQKTKKQLRRTRIEEDEEEDGWKNTKVGGRE